MPVNNYFTDKLLLQVCFEIVLDYISYLMLVNKEYWQNAFTGGVVELFMKEKNMKTIDNQIIFVKWKSVFKIKEFHRIFLYSI